jgi:hypothetical protein
MPPLSRDRSEIIFIGHPNLIWPRAMSEYWRKVLSTAWSKTWKLLSWDRAKTGTALVGLATILIAGVHLGFAAMVSSAAAAFWVAAPTAIVVVILFVWGIIETQAELYHDVDSKLTRLKGDEPNYAAVRLQDRYRLGPASRLWCDIDPGARPTLDTQSWYETFVSAIRNGQLRVESRKDTPSHLVSYRRDNPDYNTEVTRSELKRFAASIGQNPRFLRESD